jgi:hypothetical protein
VLAAVADAGTLLVAVGAQLAKIAVALAAINVLDQLGQGLLFVVGEPFDLGGIVGVPGHNRHNLTVPGSGSTGYRKQCRS